MVKAGKLKALAVMAPQRLPSASTIPTMAEAGVDMGSGTWLGLLAPAKTPKPVVERLQRRGRGGIELAGAAQVVRGAQHRARRQHAG